MPKWTVWIIIGLGMLVGAFVLGRCGGIRAAKQDIELDSARVGSVRDSTTYEAAKDSALQSREAVDRALARDAAVARAERAAARAASAAIAAARRLDSLYQRQEATLDETFAGFRTALDSAAAHVARADQRHVTDSLALHDIRIRFRRDSTALVRADSALRRSWKEGDLLRDKLKREARSKWIACGPGAGAAATKHGVEGALLLGCVADLFP